MCLADRVSKPGPCNFVAGLLKTLTSKIVPSTRYSIGSSTVMVFRLTSLSSLIAAYSVVDLPDPVGPVTGTMPLVRIEGIGPDPSASDRSSPSAGPVSGFSDECTSSSNLLEYPDLMPLRSSVRAATIEMNGTVRRVCKSSNV